MVTNEGEIVIASHSLRQDLFWGLCGSGGSQLGIVTQFKLRTVLSTPFDRAVVFRIIWPVHRAGELLHRFMQYNGDGGDTYVRIVITEKSEGMHAVLACYDVDSDEQCMRRLSRAAFFTTPEKNLKFVVKSQNALAVSGFFGPSGSWGSRFAPDICQAFNMQRYADSGKGNNKYDQSSYLTFGARPPTAAFWQKYAEYCASASLPSRPSFVCQIHTFENAVRIPQKNAFAHRGSNAFVHFTAQQASTEDRSTAHEWIRKHFEPYTTGSYVNYPDASLSYSYAEMYWGKSLGRLRALKAKYDPHLIFANPQPLMPA